jgi:hypothetical protein
MKAFKNIYLEDGSRISVLEEDYNQLKHLRRKTNLKDNDTYKLNLTTISITVLYINNKENEKQV